MARILLTAIGSFSAGIVIESLKTQGHTVIGCDLYQKPWVADAYNVDKFYQAPNASDKEKFTAFIWEITEKEKIDLIIPLIDPEVELLAELKNDFLEKNIVLCISDESAIRLCRNKYDITQFLKQEFYGNIIPTNLLSNSGAIAFPIMIKPMLGRSSQGCEKVFDLKKFNYLKEVLIGEDHIVQPFINGSVMTVDVVRDPISDEVVCVSRRELLRNPNGAGTTVEIIENYELQRLCSLIVKKVGITGAVNLEFIEDESGAFNFLEINPRFSAGLAFSHLAGYNMTINHMNCFMGRPIEKRNRIKTMIIARKYEEYITLYR